MPLIILKRKSQIEKEQVEWKIRGDSITEGVNKKIQAHSIKEETTSRWDRFLLDFQEKPCAIGKKETQRAIKNGEQKRNIKIWSPIKQNKASFFEAIKIFKTTPRYLMYISFNAAALIPKNVFKNYLSSIFG